jgi:bifunctional non-homologous end joining protein LigD
MEVRSSNTPSSKRRSFANSTQSGDAVFVSPQLATLVKEPPDGDGWLHEVKFDGYRMIAMLSRGKVRIWSRNQKDWTARFPAISTALAALKVNEAIFDGEIVTLDKHGKTSFQAFSASCMRVVAAR